MGKVYYGEQTGLNRPCAIKVLDPRLVAGDNAAEFIARFLLEASVAAKLTHPNVVTIFDYGETPDGSCFIAMEYLEGRSLSDELKRVGRLSCDRTIHIAQQICRALREAHELGAIHRDMKPGNVFLIKQDDDEDFVKVLDFGLVKETNPAGGVDPTQSAQVMGSPRYMAPEQVQGKAVDARTDVYALGAMMYAMLTGHPPFERSSELATMMAQVADAPVPLAIAAPDLVLPPGLEAVVMKCLCKDPDHRYPSMEELVAALKLDPARSAALGAGRLAAGGLAAPPLATFALKGDRQAPPRIGATRARTLMAICVVLVGAGVGGALLFRRAPGFFVRELAAPLPQVPLTSAPSAAPSPKVTATLHVETTPEGARVKEEGDTVCEATPCDIAYSGEGASPSFEHLLVFMKADYKLERKLVTVDISPVHVKLTKAR
jgi:tRNA A-37 threonylcarbamoyl transferase component Bud32